MLTGHRFLSSSNRPGQTTGVVITRRWGVSVYFVDNRSVSRRGQIAGCVIIRRGVTVDVRT